MSRYTAELFAGWIAAGRIPEDFGPAERLAFSFTGPIGLVRVLHFHADASPEVRAEARAAVGQHTDLFATAIFHGTAQQPTSHR
jgi:hypothetical protein